MSVKKFYPKRYNPVKRDPIEVVVLARKPSDSTKIKRYDGVCDICKIRHKTRTVNMMDSYSLDLLLERLSPALDNADTAIVMIE